MTGSEVAPVVAAATKAAAGAISSATEESKAISKSLRETAQDTPTWAVAGERYARRQLVKQEILLRLFKPVARVLGLSQEYFSDQFAHDMAQKLQGVPDDKITGPAPNIAGPALESMRFSLDDPNLHDLYLNLLATASITEADPAPHPAFVEVIKQLTGQEAHLLRTVLAVPNIPAVRLVRRHKENGAFQEIENHLLRLETANGLPYSNPNLAAFVDNWSRLGLVDIRYDIWRHAEDAYVWVDERPELTRARAKLVEHTEQDKAWSEWEVDKDKGLLVRTDFGALFWRIVVDQAPIRRAASEAVAEGSADGTVSEAVES